MTTAEPRGLRSRNVTSTVRHQIEAAGERIWRLSDFAGLPFPAVAQALSRLARQGQLHRLGKGLYYRSRQTAFGPSLPNTATIRSLPIRQRAVFPAGVAAANLLGFTTQNPARLELATDGLSLPRQIVGKETVIHTRRPAAWRSLSQTDAALLDFLRNRGATSELSPKETVRKLLAYLDEPGRFERLLQMAPSEPPRVRALLGAIGQQLGQPELVLASLRDSLNPLSRFDFGILATLAHANQWQAKERRSHASVSTPRL
jgi:predicted transcriptional regulator of viral defense system